MQVGGGNHRSGLTYGGGGRNRYARLIDIDDEGNVSIYSFDQDAINRQDHCSNLVCEAKVDDEVYRASGCSY